MMLVLGCLAGCSSSKEEEGQAPARAASHGEVSAAVAAKTPERENWQLHRKQLEKAGAEYDEHGHMKEGSLARIMENGGK